MTDATDTRLHTSRRDRSYLQIGRLQVRIENCLTRIAGAGSEAEADIARASLEMYRNLLATEIDTIPEDRNKP